MSTSSTQYRMTAGPFLAALVTGFLLAAPYMTNLLVEHSRQLYMWTMRDNLLLAGLLLTFALSAVLVRKLVKSLSRPYLVRVYDHLFVLTLGAGLLANLWFQTKRPVGYCLSQTGPEIRSLWIVLGIAVGWSLARPNSSLVPRCRQLCAILTPAMIIGLVNLFVAATYPTRMDPLPTAAKPENRAETCADQPVYVFIMDEWSYNRTYRNGQVRSDLPNLARLASQSVTFHAARSCADSTEISIPRFLYETDLPVTYSPGAVGFQRDQQVIATCEFDSVFKYYRSQGYATVMLGFALPFTQLLGDQVECCRSYPWFDVQPGIAGQVRTHIIRTVQYWTDPWSQFAFDRIWPDMKYDQILRRQKNMKSDILGLITRGPAKTMAVIHYALPHNPYMFLENGDPAGPLNTIYELGSVTGYERNMLAFDRFIGEITNCLQKAGRFDDAMLVFTSDHSFRYDPDRKSGKLTGPLNHVPLIVKLPGQTKPCDVQQEYALGAATKLIDTGLDVQGAGEIFAGRLLESPAKMLAERP